MSTKTEKTYQLDAGLLHKSPKFEAGASLFYNRINDFILIDGRNETYFSGPWYTPSTRNIDAQTHGFELTSSYALTNVVKFNSSLAYVKGKNKTDGLPLAQLAPLEGRLALAYDDKKYSYGALLRLVAPKDEVAAGQGNISGQDIAKSGGFGIFSLNAGYKPNKKTLIAAGVDNLFDKSYAEFISRTGNPGGATFPAGYVTSTRVNEPGRTAWLKATIALD
jgi:iron complex outermembrane receptor protein